MTTSERNKLERQSTWVCALVAVAFISGGVNQLVVKDMSSGNAAGMVALGLAAMFIRLAILAHRILEQMSVPETTSAKGLAREVR